MGRDGLVRVDVINAYHIGSIVREHLKIFVQMGMCRLRVGRAKTIEKIIGGYSDMNNSNRITVEWFEGSHYWEVNVDGGQVYTSQDKRDAQLFAAELMIKLGWV